MLTWNRSLVAVFVLGIGGCNGSERPPATEDDLTEYDALAVELEEKRTTFVEGPAQDFTAAGDVLLWIDAGAGNPVVKSYDVASGAETTYAFRPYLTGPSNPNPIDNVNFFASTAMIGTMNELDGANAYGLGAADAHLGKLVLPAPPYGQKWWAYSVDAGFVYVAVLVDTKRERAHFARMNTA